MNYAGNAMPAPLYPRRNVDEPRTQLDRSGPAVWRLCLGARSVFALAGVPPAAARDGADQGQLHPPRGAHRRVPPLHRRRTGEDGQKHAQGDEVRARAFAGQHRGRHRRQAGAAPHRAALGTVARRRLHPISAPGHSRRRAPHRHPLQGQPVGHRLHRRARADRDPQARAGHGDRL